MSARTHCTSAPNHGRALLTTACSVRCCVWCAEPLRPAPAPAAAGAAPALCQRKRCSKLNAQHNNQKRSLPDSTLNTDAQHNPQRMSCAQCLSKSEEAAVLRFGFGLRAGVRGGEERAGADSSRQMQHTITHAL